MHIQTVPEEIRQHSRMKVANQVQLLLLQPVVGLESFLNDYTVMIGIKKRMLTLLLSNEVYINNVPAEF